MLNVYLNKITKDKIGIEIGGPSPTGHSIYANVETLDNVIFSPDTVWSKHTNVYNFSPDKSGKVIINDATTINDVNDNVYDFCFASHVLEHIANPLKALNEWLRIIKNDGHIILILPERSMCFDHNRSITPFSKLKKQYDDCVKEDDLSTLHEIVLNHDYSMTNCTLNFQQFLARSLDNYNNRCLHHYVYSPELLKEICVFLQCEFVYTVTHGLDIWFIMKKLSKIT